MEMKIKIDFDKLPRGKSIGSGIHGTAYFIKIKGQSYVLKIQKIQTIHKLFNCKM